MDQIILIHPCGPVRLHLRRQCINVRGCDVVGHQRGTGRQETRGNDAQHLSHDVGLCAREDTEGAIRFRHVDTIIQIDADSEKMDPRRVEASKGRIRRVILDGYEDAAANNARDMSSGRILPRNRQTHINFLMLRAGHPYSSRWPTRPCTAPPARGMLKTMSEPAEKLQDDRVVMEAEEDEQGNIVRWTRRAPTEEERELIAAADASPRGPGLTTEEFMARVGHHIGRR
jgi:hypothetical protein